MPRRAPVIGINTEFDPPQEKTRDRYRLNANYVERVREAGGLPLLVPCVEDKKTLKAYLQKVDGFLFTGGPDYPPEFYGEKIGEKTKPMNTRRARADIFLAREAIHKMKIPVLGICAGAQLINIACGGKLIQHLPNAKKHICIGPHEDSVHPADITGGRIIAGLFGKGRITVNSSHHQAVDPDFLPETLQVSALSDDGVVEAVEPARPGRFLLGVQWHPERINDIPHRKKLFAAFIKAVKI